MRNQLLEKSMPDFLGIGAQRAGSTWLWQSLRKHPDIWMPRTKEKHFFNRRFDQRFLPVLEKDFEARLRYAVHFLKGKLLRKTVGEFTPDYVLLPPPKIETIRRWMPKIKLIFIMRNPIERSWSFGQKAFKTVTGRTLSDATTDELISFLETREVMARSNYYDYIKNWISCFPKQQFFFCFTEEILRDPVSIMKQLFAFLQVSPGAAINWDSLYNKVHASKNEVEMPQAVREHFKRLLFKDINSLEILIGRQAPWR